MALYTEKTQEEALRPLANYNGDNSYVKGQIYSMTNGGDLYDSARNYNSYKQALEDAKANDNDNFFTGIGDFFVGRSKEKQKADLADEYLKAYSADPFQFSGGSYNDDASKIKGKDLDKGQILDGGLLGGLINPISQTSKAGYDLYHGATTGDWNDWNKRDHWSDVGALGDVVLTAATLGAGTGATTLGKTLAKGALIGGGYGALGSLNEQGKDTWTANGLQNLALSTGIGGVVGGGLSGLGYGINKYANTAQKMRNPYTQYMAMAENNKTGQATNLLSDGVGGATATGKYTNPKADWVLNRGNLAKTRLGQAAQGIGDTISYNRMTGNTLGNKIANSKIGNAASKVLKTRAGKVGAGVGGGLLLAKLLGGGSNSNQLSDEELNELYNYYYGGQ